MYCSCQVEESPLGCVLDDNTILQLILLLRLQWCRQSLEARWHSFLPDTLGLW
jgi:hypothetical protein